MTGPSTSATIGRFGLFAGECRRAARRPVFYREVVAQLWTTSIRCVLLVVAVTFPFGMVMALRPGDLPHVWS